MVGEDENMLCISGINSLFIMIKPHVFVILCVIALYISIGNVNRMVYGEVPGEGRCGCDISRNNDIHTEIHLQTDK